MLMERAMVCTASERDGTGLLLVAIREISLAGMEPSKQAAPQQLPGERGLGCPPLCCLPASKLTEWMHREPRAAGWPRRGAI